MKSKHLIIPALLCVISIIPFFVISIYSRPSADDFSYSYPLFNLIKSGNYDLLLLIKESFSMMANFYRSWQGTYSSAILMSLQPGIFGDKYYFIGTIFLIVLLYICLYKLFSVINKRIIDNCVPTWFISLLFLTIFLLTVPYLNQCLYWLCGAYHYVPFFALDLLIVSYAIDYLYEDNKDKKIKDIILSSIFSFIVSGGNQVTSLLNLLILCLFILYSFYRKKDKGLLITLVIALVGFFIMFFAPGNSVRQSNTTKSSAIIAIINSFKGGLKYALRWPNASWFFFIILMVVLLLPFINKFEYKLRIHPIILIVITICLYSAMFCPTNYAMSTNGPGRLKNVIYFTGVIFSILDVVYVILWLKQKRNISFQTNNRVIFFIIVILTALMCFYKTSNFYVVVDEIKSGTAESFARAYDDRIDKMNNSNLDIVVVDSLPKSQVLKFDDITSDVNDWRNVDWSRYYGITTVIK